MESTINATTTVSVVMRTYTEARWNSFIEAVQSVQQQTIQPMEIVIIVDHNPALMKRVAAFFPEVRVLENPGVPGSGGAWNACVAASRGEIIVFFDDDAVASPNWLETLLQHYEQPDVLGVGGAIEGNWLAGRPRWFPPEFDWVVGCTYVGLPTTTVPVRNLIGCNMSFRREVFYAVGGFRSELGHLGGKPVGCDETELCVRIRQHYPGRHLLYDPGARVFHQVPPTRTTWRYFCSRCFLEGRSKALVSRFVGVQDGTSSESRYVVRVLPRGVFAGLRATLLGRDRAGILHAGAIVVGLSITTFSYAFKRMQLLFAPLAIPPAQQFEPQRTE